MDSITLPVTTQHALLIGNGDPPAACDLTSLGEPRLIVAADGGARLAQQLGLQLDCLIGDLDSISPALRQAYQAANLPIHHLPSQNINDLEKAVRWVRQQRIADLTLLGFMGQRPDQSMATLCVCKKFQQRVRFRIITGEGDIYLLPPAEYRFASRPGQVFSLFGFPEARGLTTSGLAYELKKATLKSSSRGVSNRALRDTVTIAWRKGSLIIYQLRP